MIEDASEDRGWPFARGSAFGRTRCQQPLDPRDSDHSMIRVHRLGSSIRIADQRIARPKPRSFIIGRVGLVIVQTEQRCGGFKRLKLSCAPAHESGRVPAVAPLQSFVIAIHPGARMPSRRFRDDLRSARRIG